MKWTKRRDDARRAGPETDIQTDRQTDTSERDPASQQRGRRKDEGEENWAARQEKEERGFKFECLKCRDDSGGGQSAKIKKVA